MDPFFRGWWQTKPAFDEMTSAYNASLLADAATPFSTIEYHQVRTCNCDSTCNLGEFGWHLGRSRHILRHVDCTIYMRHLGCILRLRSWRRCFGQVEDFNTDWTAAAKWTGFYEFWTHCARDLHAAAGVAVPEWAAFVRGVTLDDGKPGFW